MSEDDWDWFDEQHDDELGSASGEGDDRIQAGAEHLRSAAREVIAASRALLDVAEELVEDPSAVRDLADFIGSLGGLVAKNGGPWSSGPRRGPSEDDDDDDPDDPSVQRIPIS